MNELKIPTIQPNQYYTKIDNKDKILDFLSKENDVTKIEKYIKHNSLVLKNYPKLKIEDVIEIMEYSSYRINQLRGLEITEVLKETKKESSNLNNIEVIHTPYNVNDKNKNGFSYDFTYVKIGNELYEVTNVNKIMNFLGNKELIKEVSESEIINFIKENSKLIKKNYLDYKNNKLTEEQIEEEIKKESDSKFADALLSHKSDVLKERQKLEEYINKNMPGSIVNYGVNSNEERLYFVNDKIFKFVGPERSMQILTEDEIEKVKSGTFEEKAGYQNEEEEKITNIYDYLDKYEYLNNLVDKLYNENELTNDELKELTNFLELWITNEEQKKENPENFKYIVDKWYENTSVDKNFLNEDLENIYERIRIYRKNLVKTYELENGGFISLFAILESSLIVGLIISLIMLFK